MREELAARRSVRARDAVDAAVRRREAEPLGERPELVDAHVAVGDVRAAHVEELRARSLIERDPGGHVHRSRGESHQPASSTRMVTVVAAAE